MTRERLEAIAALVSALPHGGVEPSVSLGVSDEAVDALLACGARLGVGLHAGATVIEYVELRVGDVMFRAQRPARKARAADLEVVP
jgi:hypothetical protein